MRRAVLQDVGANVGRQFKAHRAVLVTDAWAVRVPRGEGGEAPEHGGIRPSQDPRRFEVVIISELLPNGCGTSLHCEYKRSTDGDAGSVVFEEPYEMPIRTDYTFDAFFDGVRGVTNKGDA